MEFIHQLIDFILHIDQHLVEIVREYDKATYVILALIIFCETGLVVTPFLPGDSLLFAAGALAAQQNGLELAILLPVLFLAALLGDSTNYFVGRFTGERLLAMKRQIIRREYIERTHRFYEEHGGKTVVLARFMPILRTFAPFVAGLGSMKYKRFFTFSFIGNVVWIGLFTVAGFAFGNIPLVKNNFSSVILGIILISLLPMIITFAREKMKRKPVS